MSDVQTWLLLLLSPNSHDGFSKERFHAFGEGSTEGIVDTAAEFNSPLRSRHPSFISDRANFALL